MSESEVKFYRKIFNEFDEKQKGYLSKKDAFDAVRCCGLNPSEAQLEQALTGTMQTLDARLAFMY